MSPVPKKVATPGVGCSSLSADPHPPDGPHSTHSAAPKTPSSYGPRSTRATSACTAYAKHRNVQRLASGGPVKAIWAVRAPFHVDLDRKSPDPFLSNAGAAIVTTCWPTNGTRPGAHESPS